MKKQQTPSPSFTRKAIKETMIKIMIIIITCHIHLDCGSLCGIKGAKWPAEKQQCKSLSNARELQLTQLWGCFQRPLFFSPKSLYRVCSVHEGHVPSLGHTCLLGRWEPGWALRFTCGDSYKISHQENRWQRAALVQAQEGYLRTGNSLPGEARPWLPPEGMGHTAEKGVLSLQDAGGYQPGAQGTAFLRAEMGIRSHSQPRPETIESLNIKNSHQGGCRTDGVWLTAWAVNLPTKSQGFQWPQYCLSTYCLSPSFQNARAHPKQTDRWQFHC